MVPREPAPSLVSSPGLEVGAAVMVPGVIALLAIYVRATCPESPYWVRSQDRMRRIVDMLAAEAR